MNRARACQQLESGPPMHSLCIPFASSSLSPLQNLDRLPFSHTHPLCGRAGSCADQSRSSGRIARSPRPPPPSPPPSWPPAVGRSRPAAPEGPQRKGGGSATNAVEHMRQRRCLSHECSRTHAAKGGVLVTNAVEHTRQRRCLSHECSGTHKAKGGVLVTNAVEHTRQKAVS